MSDINVSIKLIRIKIFSQTESSKNSEFNTAIFYMILPMRTTINNGINSSSNCDYRFFSLSSLVDILFTKIQISTFQMYVIAFH